MKDTNVECRTDHFFKVKNGSLDKLDLDEKEGSKRNRMPI